MRIHPLLPILLLVSTSAAEPQSQAVKAAKTAGEEWTNPLRTTFCWCPPGTITLRDKDGAKPEKGRIEKGFWLGKYEVTKREFDLVTPKKPRGALATMPDHPRDSIRHDDILQFIAELNRRERFFQRLPEGWTYALPTEAEWEYACRAGTKTAYSFGNDATLLPAYGNFSDRRLLDSGDDYYRYAHDSFDDGVAFLAKVGTFKPNAWGFHDMHGNLWEWTASLDRNGHPIARGGSWVSLPNYCESRFRRAFPVTSERNFIGFRLALKQTAPADSTAADGGQRKRFHALKPSL